MKKARLSVVAMKDIDISLCPYCGAPPIMVVSTGEDIWESTRVTNQEVKCPCCGLSAMPDVWESIANRFEESICDEEEAEEGDQ